MTYVYSWPVERLEHAQAIAAQLTEQNHAGRQALGMYRQRYEVRSFDDRAALIAVPVCLTELAHWLQGRDS